MSNIESGTFITWALNMLLKKIVVPSDFKHQVQAVKELQMDDVSGLVDSLTDFSVNSASVKYSIETGNEKLNDILENWADKINIEYQGKIPIGLTQLAKEYFKERWKYSSFPVLKITKWTATPEGIILPTKMFFVDGGSITYKDLNEKDDNLKLINYEYYLGDPKNKNKLDKGVIFSRPFGRWFDKYPIPYLIKRGVYHNWKLVQSIKKHQSRILEQIIPYILLIKKGFQGQTPDTSKFYSNEQLGQVIQDLQNLVDKANANSTDGHQVKSPTRGTNFDEDIKHLIPDLSTIFDQKLFPQAERNILAGLGFVDIAQSISESRRESILNPKVFIEEVRAGVEDFKQQILKPLLFMINEKNKRHKKYMNFKFYICSSPVKAFMTDDFKEKVRQLYDRGRISSQTAVELIAETDFQTEVLRREREAKEGIETKLYPPVTDNREGQGVDIPGEDPIEEPIEEENPDDKTGIEKKNFKNSKTELETAPYKNIQSLPPRIKNNMSSGLQRTFVRVFNNAFQQYHSETRAFRVAWSVIRRIARKNKKGKWVRKTGARINKAMLEEILEKEDAQILEKAMTKMQAENQTLQNELLKKLVKNKKDKKE